MTPERDYYTRRLADEAASDPLFSRIAGLVHLKGVDPTTAVIADFFPDDRAFYFGLLVTPAGRVFQFGYDWLHTHEMEGQLSEWKELTSGWEGGIYAEPIALGLELAAAAT